MTYFAKGASKGYGEEVTGCLHKEVRLKQAWLPPNSRSSLTGQRTITSWASTWNVLAQNPTALSPESNISASNTALREMSVLGGLLTGDQAITYGCLIHPVASLDLPPFSPEAEVNISLSITHSVFNTACSD